MESLNPKIRLQINEKISSVASSLGLNNVLIHSDIRSLYLFDFNSKKDLLEKHINNLNEIFNDFNIWMPTFNYDFTKTGVYNVNEDESQIGNLNEFYRKTSDWRSTTPVFNFCGNGNYPINKISNGDIINPFNKDSEYHFLYETNSIQCHYGSNISHATLFHYVEGISKKLSYRFSKKFHGIVINNDIKTSITLDYHVFPLKTKMRYDWSKINSDLLSENLIHSYKIFNSIDYIMVFSIKNVTDFWLKKLNSDPFYFLNENSKKYAKNKIQELGRGFILEDFE